MTPAATPAPPGIDLTRTALGIEFGSTRIKAVLTDPSGAVLASGGHTWENSLVDGVWTYSIDEVETGLRAAYAALAKDLRAARGVELTTVGAIGVSGMMHGYLPLDDQGRPLTAFRTWRNTITAESSAALSALFGLNIPQRWSISHLHRAVTGSEEHVEGIARITTLAGYVHWRLIGRHVLGVGEASGVFPIGASGRSFDTDMIAAFDGAVTAPWSLADILPEVAVAGREAGRLTESGAALLDPTGALRPGIPLCPPEGDAGTGMVATDSVRPRTGNVSASTSAFAMIVLEAPLRSLIEEIDLVATPSGAPVAMAHANNCTSDLNAWVEVFSQFAEAIGAPVERGRLFDVLLGAAAQGDMDEAGVISHNFLSGDALVHLPAGRPLTMRRPGSALPWPASYARTCSPCSPPWPTGSACSGAAPTCPSTPCPLTGASSPRPRSCSGPWPRPSTHPCPWPPPPRRAAPGACPSWPATCCGGAVGHWRTTWTGRSSPTPGP